VPHALFRVMDGGITPNVLSVRVQPDEGISLRFTSKEPGQQTLLRDVAMDFRYGTTFGSNTPEAYERLLIDAMRGEATLFTRRDEVEAQWTYMDRVLEAWATDGRPPPPAYASGSWGPEQADDLLVRPPPRCPRRARARPTSSSSRHRPIGPPRGSRSSTRSCWSCRRARS
jgi:glucose-6-phosphate 1-dehydrogenase